MAITQFLKERKGACKNLLNKLLEKYAYASILGVDSKGFSIRTDRINTMIKDSDNEQGFVIKVYDGKGYLEYSCSDINDNNYLDVYNDVLAIKVDGNLKRVNAKMLEEEELTKVFERVDNYPVSIEKITDTLKEMKDETLKYSDKIINAMVMFMSFTVSKMFLSKKKDLEQSYPYHNCTLISIARNGNNIKDSMEAFGDKDTLPLLEAAKAKVKDNAKLSIEMLDAQPITPGVYDVITDPTISGLIAHEAFGHGVEMDMFVKNRAKAKDFIGKYVASPLVSMHDGASAVENVASYFFDDDGVLAQDTLIIKDGILQTGISDALSAMQLGTTPTGNGRRQEFTHKAYTRMTNTFFSKGESKLEDMIKSIDYGFYLVNTNNGMEDPKNWQIQCVCEYAREIKNGKFTGRLFTPVVMSGYVLDLLKSISMVSDGFEVLGSGHCGKGHKEWVRVSDGGPHLKCRVKLG